MKTYNITLEDGTELSLRLTSRAIGKYCDKHGGNMPPAVAVLQAVNSMDAQISLFTAALLHPDNKNAVQDGAALIDALNDEDKGDGYRRELIVRLAADAGLIERDVVGEMVEAMRCDADATCGKVIKLLRGEPIDGASSEMETSEEDPI